MKKIPMRKCLALNTSFPKKELIRIVRTTQGEVKIDITGKLNGKGCYISKNLEAVLVAKKKNLFAKALEMEVDPSIYDELERLVSE